MAFKSLNETQEMRLRLLEKAVGARDRATLSVLEAEVKLEFLAQAKPLLEGDPWLLAESVMVQAGYRAHHAESSGFAYQKLADALLTLKGSDKLIEESWSEITGEGDD